MTLSFNRTKKNYSGEGISLLKKAYLKARTVEEVAQIRYPQKLMIALMCVRGHSYIYPFNYTIINVYGNKEKKDASWRFTIYRDHGHWATELKKEFDRRLEPDFEELVVEPQYTKERKSALRRVTGFTTRKPLVPEIELRKQSHEKWMNHIGSAGWDEYIKNYKYNNTRKY